VAAFKRAWAELGGAADAAEAAGAAESVKRARRDLGAAAPDAGPRLAPALPRRLAWGAYNLTTDEQLDEDLREFGLPTAGSRESRVDLHRAFLLAYNAVVDGGAAPDTAEVRKHVLAERAARSSARLFQGGDAAAPSSNAAASTAAPPPAPVPAHAARAQARYRSAERSRWTWLRVPEEWRAVWSDRLDQPVYFNARSNEATTAPPDCLTQDDLRAESRVVVVAAAAAARPSPPPPQPTAAPPELG